MRALLALAMLLPLLAGCASFAGNDWSCREGDGPFFLVVGRTAGFGPPEWHERTYRESLDRDGRMFVYAGKETSGEGAITFAPDGPITMSAAEVALALDRLGALNLSLDYEVAMAWAGTMDPAMFDGLCQVVHDEWVTPRGDPKAVGVCDDGGTATYDISTERGETRKVWDCAGTVHTFAAWDSLSRLNDAYNQAVDRSRPTG